MVVAATTDRIVLAAVVFEAVVFAVIVVATTDRVVLAAVVLAAVVLAGIVIAATTGRHGH